MNKPYECLAEKWPRRRHPSGLLFALTGAAKLRIGLVHEYGSSYFPWNQGILAVVPRLGALKIERSLIIEGPSWSKSGGM
jgi:hypothetical protein